MLKGKNAIITGARRGIGRATVETFASFGANVWACARKPDDSFEADMQQVAEKYDVGRSILMLQMKLRSSRLCRLSESKRLVLTPW